MNNPDDRKIAHHFVDEAGDLTLFDKSGRVLVGTEGVSHTFLVGVAEVPNPTMVGTELEALRAHLLADPYFRNVPSMQLAARKTAIAFHAKDDVPEVRREVLRLLPNFNAKIFVAIRRKAVLAEDFRAFYRRTGRKRSIDLVYDDLVTKIFMNRLHLADENHIVFARRGKADRNVALNDAIRLAKREFEGRWRKGIDRPTTISSSVPSQTASLQIVDYYLWALQRLLERREDRFFQMLAPGYRLIIDQDDQRRNRYGEYYTSKSPLTVETVKPVL